MEDYKQTYEEFWKELVEAPDGTLDKDKVMRELSDYARMMREVGKVYYHVTDGMISKPNTAAIHVIQKHDELQMEAVEEAIKDDREARAS